MFDFEITIGGKELGVEVTDFEYEPGSAWGETDVDCVGWVEAVSYKLIDEEGNEVKAEDLSPEDQQTLQDAVFEACDQYLEEQAAKDYESL